MSNIHKVWTPDAQAEWRELCPEGRCSQRPSSPLLTNMGQDRRECLNARLTFSGGTLVMPISLHYTGVFDDSDDSVRVNGCLDGKTGPLVAWSIPDRAYLGWVSEMIPNNEEMVEDYFKPASGREAALEDRIPAYVVSGDRRIASEVEDWTALSVDSIVCMKKGVRAA